MAEFLICRVYSGVAPAWVLKVDLGDSKRAPAARLDDWRKRRLDSTTLPMELIAQH
jgi:hypothetical protein